MLVSILGIGDTGFVVAVQFPFGIVVNGVIKLIEEPLFKFFVLIESNAVRKVLFSKLALHFIGMPDLEFGQSAREIGTVHP